MNIIYPKWENCLQFTHGVVRNSITSRLLQKCIMYKQIQCYAFSLKLVYNLSKVCNVVRNMCIQVKQIVDIFIPFIFQVHFLVRENLLAIDELRDEHDKIYEEIHECFGLERCRKQENFLEIPTRNNMNHTKTLKRKIMRTFINDIARFLPPNSKQFLILQGFLDNFVRF